jgi:hypothetical protein
MVLKIIKILPARKKVEIIGKQVKKTIEKRKQNLKGFKPVSKKLFGYTKVVGGWVGGGWVM